jgi:REP element-mobilizing transposase RayT
MDSNKSDPPAKWSQPIDSFLSSRRRLPHLQLPGSLYFTTSCTARPRSLSEIERDIVLNAIKFLDGKKYDLDAAVVMPDHFHLIFEPLPKSASGLYTLSEIFHSIKTFTAHEIGGHVWQHENYDHVIRNDRDLAEKRYYIRNNPVKAALCASPEEYLWLYHKG